MKGTFSKPHDKNNDVSWCKFMQRNTGAGFFLLGFLSLCQRMSDIVVGAESWEERMDEKR